MMRIVSPWKESAMNETTAVVSSGFPPVYDLLKCCINARAKGVCLTAPPSPKFESCGDIVSYIGGSVAFAKASCRRLDEDHLCEFTALRTLTRTISFATSCGEHCGMPSLPSCGQQAADTIYSRL